MTDLNEALARPGDGPVAPAPHVAEPKKSSRKAADAPDPALAALQAENAALKAQMEQVLTALAALTPGTPAAEQVKRNELDRKRPFSKTRTLSGGVTHEQDGRIFDARGRLIESEA